VSATSASLLVLTVTRACNLRCSYCPTAKDGWPSLTENDARRALDLFASDFGGGAVKIFGGEPLLVPDVVRAALAHSETLPAIRTIQLSTNGLMLDDEWLALARQHPKTILQISMDGRPDDHRRHRRSLPRVGDTYDRVAELAPKLARMPRVVVTQTIPPSTAAFADENFAHLLGLGFRRFNFLPGYYIPWTDEQLAALDRSFDRMAERIETAWRAGERLYVRNLTTLAPTPFFNSGLVVDADRAIHPSNVGLSGALEELLDETRCGDLDAPPTPEALATKQREVNALLERTLTPRVWSSTLAADAALTRFCRRLMPKWADARRARAA
jgi:sulfatase maturation enzyme AslB (radical SAM superfamily)